MSRAARGATPDVDTVFGLRAGLSVFTHRRDEISRVAYSDEARGEVEPLIRWAASAKVPCERVDPARLAHIAGSTLHEGLCVAARPRKWASPVELAELLVARKGLCVAFDRVRNPYNVGAILRTAAFFGVDAAVLGSQAPHPALAPDAVRVAEGGVERMTLARTTDLADTLERLRARGVRVVGADGQAPQRAFGFPFARPTVLVLGHEREGLSPRVRGKCDAVVSIPGTGGVESLNVSVAAGVLIAEMVRR